MAGMEDKAAVMAESEQVDVSGFTLGELRESLLSQTDPIAKRIRCVFMLRNKGGHRAVEVLAEALDDPSVLLAHEVAFCLGQMKDPHAVPFLTRGLENEGGSTIVRHECAEALGAIGEPGSLDVLLRFCRDPAPEVSQTCELAVGRIRYVAEQAAKGAADGGAAQRSAYDTLDPVPAMPADTPVPQLRAQLCDTSLPLFERYRAMFALRDANTEEAVLALAEGLSDDKSALLRHEIAYVMGQLQHAAAVPALERVLRNQDEHAMVRHEAAEALGSIADPRVFAVLKEYRKGDKDRIVQQSCDVALDIADYWLTPAEVDVANAFGKSE